LKGNYEAETIDKARHKWPCQNGQMGGKRELEAIESKKRRIAKTKNNHDRRETVNFPRAIQDVCEWRKQKEPDSIKIRGGPFPLHSADEWGKKKNENLNRSRERGEPG